MVFERAISGGSDDLVEALQTATRGGGEGGTFCNLQLL